MCDGVIEVLTALHWRAFRIKPHPNFYYFGLCPALLLYNYFKVCQCHRILCNKLLVGTAPFLVLWAEVSKFSPIIKFFTWP